MPDSLNPKLMILHHRVMLESFANVAELRQRFHKFLKFPRTCFLHAIFTFYCRQKNPSSNANCVVSMSNNQHLRSAKI